MENEITVNGAVYVLKNSMPQLPQIGDRVIIRTYSAGVHVGILEQPWTKEGEVVTLKNSRRIWRWRGGNTLNEVAMNGVNREQYTRISEMTVEIQLIPIEVIPVADGIDLTEVWND